jgi:tyrosinase
MALRKNIRNLSPNDLSKLREAHRRIMARSDNRSYQYIAGRHGYLDQYCEHAPTTDEMGRQIDLFLPWHRAYMYHFERYLQIALDDNDVAAHWWDWHDSRFDSEGIPRAYSEERVAGQPNPLYSFKMNIRGRPRTRPEQPPVRINRNTRRRVGVDFTLSGIRAVAVARRVDLPDLYRITDYSEFSEGLRGVWHNLIHGYVGGDMANQNLAAYDPIFYPHHINIDRIWYIWQRAHGPPSQSVPDYLKGQVLSPFRMTVEDVLDIGGLNYGYARSIGGD